MVASVVVLRSPRCFLCTVHTYGVRSTYRVLGSGKDPRLFSFALDDTVGFDLKRSESLCPTGTPNLTLLLTVGYRIGVLPVYYST